jgi:hypothetical protein
VQSCWRKRGLAQDALSLNVLHCAAISGRIRVPLSLRRAWRSERPHVASRSDNGTHTRSVVSTTSFRDLYVCLLRTQFHPHGDFWPTGKFNPSSAPPRCWNWGLLTPSPEFNIHPRVKFGAAGHCDPNLTPPPPPPPMLNLVSSRTEPCI